MYFLAGLMTAAYMLFCGGNTIISRADEVRKTITDAKIRSEADTGSSQVGSAPQGTTFSVGEPTTGTDGKPWYQVSINGQSGYIRADLTESAGEGGEDFPLHGGAAAEIGLHPLPALLRLGLAALLKTVLNAPLLLLRPLPEAAEILLGKGRDHLCPFGKTAQVLVLLRQAGENLP